MLLTPRRFDWKKDGQMAHFWMGQARKSLVLGFRGMGVRV